MSLDAGASSRELDSKCTEYSSSGPARPGRDHRVPATLQRYVKHSDQKVYLLERAPTVASVELQSGEEAGGRADLALEEGVQMARPQSLGHLPACDLTCFSQVEECCVFLRCLLSKCSDVPSEHLYPASLTVSLRTRGSTEVNTLGRVSGFIHI